MRFRARRKPLHPPLPLGYHPVHDSHHSTLRAGALQRCPGMTLLWYDLETFGRSPRFDRIAQFAALRTDDDFRPLEEPVVLYGKLSPDYLPDPLASLLTGITPQDVNTKGIIEAELVRAVDTHFSRPGTCALGYNSIGFDDEFIRNLYYRNFYDPYRREWAGGNSRWDIINLVRAARDLRPEGISWPTNEEGKPSVKLELFAEANGLEHDHAHDALSDVHATIAAARLIRQKQPKLFEWSWKHRTKEAARTLIDLADRTPLVHTSPFFSDDRGSTSLVSPIVTHPERRSTVYAFDLRFDPEPLISLPEDEIRRRLFTSAAELDAAGLQRIPLTGIAMNKAPFLAPRSVLTREAASRLGIDLIAAEAHWKRLKGEGGLAGKLRRVLSGLHPSASAPSDDPDMQIYDRFFPNEDRSVLEDIRNTPPGELSQLNITAKDPRIPEMLRRYIGRNYPDMLDEEGRRRWRSFCASRILFPPIPEATDLGQYRKRLAAWMESDELEAARKPIVKALQDYGDYLEETLIDSDSGSSPEKR